MGFLFKRQFKRSQPFTIKQGEVKLGKLNRGSADDWLVETTSTKETIGKNFDINKVFKISIILLLF
ncbi:MAG: hypothetical protein ABIB72_00800, partial [Candidatus Falkowbacteria bacterium]